MATPIKPNIGTKTNFAVRPSVPSTKKQTADEFNLLVEAVRANYERLILYWDTDIGVSVTLPVGQYVIFEDSLYRIITAYSVGDPITWVPENATLVISGSSDVAFNEITGAASDNASLVAYVANKADAKATVSPHIGSYTLAAADLTDINAGKTLIIEGNNSGTLTVPLNATVAFPTGPNTLIGLRGYTSVIATGGVTITGTNGTLNIPAGQTAVLEKTGTNTWILNNGGVSGGGGVASYYGVTAGTNSYTSALSPTLASLGAGVTAKVKFLAASSGAATFNPDSLGAKKIFKNTTTQAGNGNILVGIYDLTYDPTLDSAAGGWLMEVDNVTSGGAFTWGLGSGTLASQTDLQAALDAKLATEIAVNAPNMSVATSYTLQNSDCNKMLQMSKATAQDVLVPSTTTATIDVYKPILVVQTGAGQVTFNPDTGVTILSVSLRKRLFAQYSAAFLVRMSANTWLLEGDLVS